MAEDGSGGELEEDWRPTEARVRAVLWEAEGHLERREYVAAARALKPMYERQMLGRSIFLFDRVDRQQLAALGDVRTPGIADLFVAVLEKGAGNPAATARDNYEGAVR